VVQRDIALVTATHIVHQMELVPVMEM
jgi:hypothetical protein